MATDFSRYLDVPVESIPENFVSLPAGHYLARITSWKGAERSYEGKGGPLTPVVELAFKITAPCDDIEESLLPESGGVGKIITRDYTLSDPDQSGQTMIRQLAEKTCGLATQGLHLSDVLDALKEQDVKIYNEPRPGKDEGQFFPKVAKVLAVDA